MKLKLYSRQIHTPRLILGEKRPKSWTCTLVQTRYHDIAILKTTPKSPPSIVIPRKNLDHVLRRDCTAFFIPFYINMVIKGMSFNYGVRTALHITWAKPLEVDLFYLIRLRNTKWAFLMSINLPSFHLDSAVTNLFQSYKTTAAETKAHSYLWQFQKEKLHNIRAIETNE